MIFINNALKKIGNEGLIVSLKANNFYEGEESFSQEDFDQLFEVYRASPKIDLPTSTKNNHIILWNYGKKSVYIFFRYEQLPGVYL